MAGHATTNPAPRAARHPLAPLVGRDPDEPHRAATPLELIYDLTIVVAFSVAGSELAHQIAHGHVLAGLIGFAFVMFAVVWAWLGYTWFHSAYDNDDWFVRVATMVQMVGVVVVAIGIGPLFAGLADGWHLDNRVMVAGYVVMRVPLVALWSRVGHGDLDRRPAVLTYISTLVVAQLGWIAVAIVDFRLPVAAVLMLGLYGLELSGPVLAERKSPTPWHAHHVAERYSLLVIIALGEVIVGTTLSVTAAISAAGWSGSTAVLAFAGIGLCFGIWWVYFAMPFGTMLSLRRDRGFVWGYGHLPLFGALAAIGAGLHVAALRMSGEAELSTLAVVAATAVPLGLAMAMMFALVYVFLPGRQVLHQALGLGTVVLIGLALVFAAKDAPLWACLLLLTAAPWAWVVGYELLGHRHVQAGLDTLAAQPR